MVGGAGGTGGRGEGGKGEVGEGGKEGFKSRELEASWKGTQAMNRFCRLLSSCFTTARENRKRESVERGEWRWKCAVRTELQTQWEEAVKSSRTIRIKVLVRSGA